MSLKAGIGKSLSELSAILFFAVSNANDCALAEEIFIENSKRHKKFISNLKLHRLKLLLNSEIFHHLPASVRLLPEDGEVGALAMHRLFGLRVGSSDFESAAAVGHVARNLSLLV